MSYPGCFQFGSIFSATATRVLAGFWYFFTFVILAIIVGNLCESVLWVDEDFSRLETIHGLLNTRGMKFTCIEAGATCRTLEVREPFPATISQSLPYSWQIDGRKYYARTKKEARHSPLSLNLSARKQLHQIEPGAEEDLG
ncbi:glutamate receptor [Tropilaelaps mercedesae]|uniref:Glutamate receptor n=1 Tax=Tropilaelaps mercedesae TaxID=418985 RepID=A0A1V9X726_9ACAR|nr:glutamate receptor [Tropilaelaps mercedesae]